MLINGFRQLYDLLDSRERYLGTIVFLMMVVTATVDIAGITSIVPLISLLSNPEIIQTNQYLSRAYDLFGFSSERDFVFYFGLLVFFVLIFSLLIRAMNFWLQVRFTNMRNHAIGYRLLSRYLARSYATHVNHNSSDSSSKILQEVSQVVNGALFPAMQILTNLILAIFISVLLVYTDPFLALLLLFVLAIAYGVTFLVAQTPLKLLGEARYVANLKRFRVIQEAFNGFKDIKIRGLEMMLLERFRAPSVVVAKSATQMKILGQIPSFAMQGILFGGMILVILYVMGTAGNIANALPVLALYAFAGYRLMPALQVIYKSLTEFKYSAPSLDSLHADYMSLGELIPSATKDDEISLNSSIKLENVSFSYSNSNDLVLKDFSVEIRALTTVGVVGPSGSGKTTAIDLILGLLLPNVGYLTIDNKRIDRTNVSLWQKNVGYVPQDIFLADDTVAANIAFGLPGEQIEIDKVKQAARLANLHEYIEQETEDGYGTVVGERGIKLSGGQRQRIGIARALYNDPAVLIFDEATSALDNLTERAVMEAVNNLTRKKTIIIIAHRLTTIQNCDQIIVIENGKAVASGAYSELLERSSLFRNMALAEDRVN